MTPRAASSQRGRNGGAHAAHGLEASVRGFGVIGMSLLAVDVSVITGIDAWVSTTMAGASARLKRCERLKQIVWAAFVKGYQTPARHLAVRLGGQVSDKPRGRKPRAGMDTTVRRAGAMGI